MRVFNMILESIQVLVSFTAITNGALIGFGRFVVFTKATVPMFLVIFQTIGILVSLVTALNSTLVRLVRVQI
jgi:hypothetical protein